MSKPFAFSYLAFSTLQQKKGRSSDRQHSAAEAWSKAHGFRLAAERQYCDEGISRFNGKARMKGALSRFLKLCGTPSVPAGSVLIIEDFDRLSRENADDAWELFRGILLTGVEIVVLSMDRWFKRESLQRFEDRLLVQACQHRAHNESKMKADRQRDIWADRRRRAVRGKGIHTKLPTWIQRNAETGELELIPERKETILLAVRLVREMGTRRAAGALSKGPHARPCWLDRGEWDSECLQQILRRPAVWGAYQPLKLDERRRLVPAGELVEGHYPAVLKKEEAEAIRRAMTSRKNHRGKPSKHDRNVLRYLVRDAETGQHLRLKRSGTHAQKEYLDRRWQGRSQLICPYQVMETLVLRAVEEWMPDALAPKVTNEVRQQIKELQAELADVARDRDGIRAALAKPGRAASTAAILAEQLDAIDKREEEIKEALAEAETRVGGVPSQVLRECQSLAAELHRLPADKLPEARRHLNDRLREVLDGVWVYRRRITARTGELIVQVWPRAGEVKEGRVFLGAPPDDYRPLDTRGVDFRKGYPLPLVKRKREKNPTESH